MNISICLTVFNEGKSISRLLDSLLVQSLKPKEIIIVDGGSTDRTIEILKHYQKKDNKIRLLLEKCSRAKGRNLGIEIAKNEIIAITDAGCIVHPDWLEKITEPFNVAEVDISAGFYKMTGEAPMQKAGTIFLGVTPSEFDVTFLPSTRSIAFRKKAWELVGGFPDEDKNSAEDTYFNYAALKAGLKYARVKNAIVEWGMPETLEDFFNKIKNYAMWDARTKIWLFPGKGLMSHNIKSLFITLRYVLGITILVLGFKFPYLLPLLIILFITYLLWAFRKVFLEFREVKVAIWGPILQIVCDFGVMTGFVKGVLN